MSVPAEQFKFNIAMLVALRRYKPKAARAILRECQHHIQVDGWDAARRWWAAFVNQGGEG